MRLSRRLQEGACTMANQLTIPRQFVELQFLTQKERDEMQSIINEAHFNRIHRDCHARLLQAQSDIKAYTHAIRLAMQAGDYDSIYVKSLTGKLEVAIAQEEELKVLVGSDTKQVA